MRLIRLRSSSPSASSLPDQRARRRWHKIFDPVRRCRRRQLMDTTVKGRLASRLVPLLVLVVLTLGAAREVTGQTPPAGEVVMAWPITIAPSWFDPSTAPPQITPFGILYAVHDALVRTLPGQKVGHSVAESWTESTDG